MAIKFQYNKTSLQTLNKSLKMRNMALPIIKNKESALRLEVKRTKGAHTASLELEKEQQAVLDKYKKLWSQFNFNLVKVEETKLSNRKIAGVRIPILEEVIFKTPETFWFNQWVWVSEAVLDLRKLTRLQIETRVLQLQLNTLEHERKRTTQKVNLYEKVQIPEIESGIKKIKRFLEDEENLSKAAQKMVKSRNAAA
ncbi:MAG: V-type ATP synthase subunit D [Crocinitomicaceae bacterium]|nr:V-type ATP synthase subunit D [Crocinitomicaceae bacterium]